MVLDDRTHTGELRDMVTSRGTTIRGIRVLEDRGVRIAMMDAVIEHVNGQEAGQN
jgi:pyrroline-5-carboxylate reductase